MSFTITKEEMKIMKEITNVSPNITFRSDTLKVVADKGKMLVWWKWEKEIENNFDVYDTDKFITVLSNYQNPDIDYALKGDRVIKVLVSEDGSDVNKTEFSTSDPTLMASVPDIADFKKKLSSDPVKFTLSESDMLKIKKHSSTLNVEELKFQGNKLIAYNSDEPNGNKHTLTISPDKPIDVCAISVIRFNSMILSDYEVLIYDKAIMFKCTKLPIVYCIARMKNV